MGLDRGPRPGVPDTHLKNRRCLADTANRDMDRDKGQITPRVKRVRLPSGKTIEVIRFSEPAPVEADDLHICQGCRSELVYPTRWTEASEDSWEITLRCPECDEIHEGVFTQASIDVFDEQLEAGTESLTDDLRRLTRTNMVEEGRRFAAALAADAILPEDF